MMMGWSYQELRQAPSFWVPLIPGVYARIKGNDL